MQIVEYGQIFHLFLEECFDFFVEETSVEVGECVAVAYQFSEHTQAWREFYGVAYAGDIVILCKEFIIGETHAAKHYGTTAQLFASGREHGVGRLVLGGDYQVGPSTGGVNTVDPMFAY